MSHPDPRTATTPLKVIVAAVEQLRRIALITHPAPARPEAAPTCGEECAEDHAYAGRCRQTPVPYYGAYSPQLHIGGERQTCGCRDNPAASNDGLREQYMAAIDAVTGGKCPMDIIDAVMRVRDRRMEQLAAGRETWKAKAEEIEADRDRLLCESPWLRASDEDRQAAETALAMQKGISADLRVESRARGEKLATAEAKVARVLDLVTRTGLIDPAELHAALDTPAPRQPVYDAVRDGHHDHDGEQPAAWTPPPPVPPPSNSPPKSSRSSTGSYPTTHPPHARPPTPSPAPRPTATPSTTNSASTPNVYTPGAASITSSPASSAPAAATRLDPDT